METTKVSRETTGTVNENGNGLFVDETDHTRFGPNEYIHKHLEPYKGKKIKVKITLEIEEV